MFVILLSFQLHGEVRCTIIVAHYERVFVYLCGGLRVLHVEHSSLRPSSRLSCCCCCLLLVWSTPAQPTSSSSFNAEPKHGEKKPSFFVETTGTTVLNTCTHTLCSAGGMHQRSGERHNYTDRRLCNSHHPYHRAIGCLL